jgi:hypothetical protein
MGGKVVFRSKCRSQNPKMTRRIIDTTNRAGTSVQSTRERQEGRRIRYERWVKQLTRGRPSVLGDTTFCQAEAEQAQSGSNEKSSNPVDSSIFIDVPKSWIVFRNHKESNGDREYSNPTKEIKEISPSVPVPMSARRLCNVQGKAGAIDDSLAYCCYGTSDGCT